VSLRPPTKRDSHRDADKLVARVTNKGHSTMLGGLLSRPWTGTTRPVRWRNRIVIILACLAILAGAKYMARCALLLNIARIILNRDSAAQCNSGVPLIEATRTVFATALSRGMGAENLTGIVRLYRPGHCVARGADRRRSN
jgi:hypothetical protein